uniref:Glycosyltransferase n=1 Tax=candidate division WOR-3 bacterium TaxID=2052148 RepID=A0A7C2PKC5_UNCW3
MMAVYGDSCLFSYLSLYPSCGEDQMKGLGLRVAVVHPLFGWGGTESVCSWVLQALQEEYKVTLLTLDEKVNFERLNKFYGTSIDPEKVEILRLRAPILLSDNMSRFAVLRQHYVMRLCKKLNDNFDIFFSTYNEMDFGKPGIQYVHFPFFVGYELSKLKEETYSRVWYHKPNIVRSIYEIIGRKISNFDIENALRNLTLVNSLWTAQIFESAYKVKPEVLYPPVFVSSYQIERYSLSYEKRENGFVAIGRIEPTKRFMEIIEIVKKVRESGFDVHLHIVGKPGEQKYYKKIVELSRLHSDWLFIETDMDREQLLKLLGYHKYGIHGKINEHFGIAIAEMVKLGILPFVHNSGGQVEIIDANELKYEDINEAVRKILNVLRNPLLERELRSKINNRAENFSETAFMEKVKEIVNRITFK